MGVLAFQRGEINPVVRIRAGIGMIAGEKHEVLPVGEKYWPTMSCDLRAHFGDLFRRGARRNRDAEYSACRVGSEKDCPVGPQPAATRPDDGTNIRDRATCYRKTAQRAYP